MTTLVPVTCEEASFYRELNGRGIMRIERTAGTGAAGTVDTYTIFYTDATVSTFEVTNGQNGIPQGEELVAIALQAIADAQAAQQAAEISATASATSASTAQGYAADAEAQAIHAADMSSDAAGFAVQAEAARDAAYVNADVYATIAAGLAATTVNQQFQVVSEDGLTVQRHRHDAGPVATPVGPPFPTVRGQVAAIGFIVVNDYYPFSSDVVRLQTDVSGSFVLGGVINGKAFDVPTFNTDRYVTAERNEGPYGLIGYAVIYKTAGGDEYLIEADGVYLVSANAENSSEPETPAEPLCYGVLMIAGASNAEGRGSAADSPLIPSGVAKQWYSGALTDVLGDPVGGADTGSAWPTVARSLWLNSGLGTVFIPRGKGGGAALLDAAASSASLSWGPAGTLRNQLRDEYLALIAELESQNVPWQNFGLVWDQGGRDATAFDDGVAGVGLVQYRDALISFIDFVRDFTGCPRLPFVISHNPLQTAGRVMVYEAQRAAAKSVPNVFIGFTGARTFPARGLMQSDGIHYVQQGYNEQGAHIATTLASVAIGNP